MVKKRVGGAHRYQKAAAAAGGKQLRTPSTAAAAGADSGGPKPAQHLQRKITKKAAFFERVASSNAALQAQARVQKRRGKKAAALPDLRSLAGELKQLAAAQGQEQKQQQQQQSRKGTGSSVKRAKARLALGLRESQRLQQVLAHPSFQADPVAAITNHLTATLPPAPAPRRGGAKQQQAGGKKAKARKQQRGGAGVADMQS